MWRRDQLHIETDLPSMTLFSVPLLNLASEAPLQKGQTLGISHSRHPHCPPPHNGRWRKGPLTMRTAAMGMAVFMKTVEEAQREFSRMKKTAGGEASQVGLEAGQPLGSLPSLQGGARAWEGQKSQPYGTSSSLPCALKMLIPCPGVI